LPFSQSSRWWRRAPLSVLLAIAFVAGGAIQNFRS